MVSKQNDPTRRCAWPVVVDQFAADRTPDNTASGATPRTDEMRIRRLVERVHDLGPAPLLHLLRDIDRGADLHLTLERYAALPVDFVRALGGDSFPSNLQALAGGQQ